MKGSGFRHVASFLAAIVAIVVAASPMAGGSHQEDVADWTHVTFDQPFYTYIHECGNGPETGYYDATLIAYPEDGEESSNATVGETHRVFLWGPDDNCRSQDYQAEFEGQFTDANSAGPGWYTYGYKLVGASDPEGTYTVDGTWYDYNGWGMEVQSANEPPSADFSYTPDAPTVSEAIQFTDQSSDPEGNIHAWEWSFGDGDTSTQQAPSHSYASSGEYVVELTVTDADGATASVTKTLSVSSEESGSPASSDTQGPVVEDFSISDDSFQPGDQMTITVDATDETDITRLYFRYEHVDGGGAVFDAYRDFSPGVESGTYDIKYTWPDGTPGGTYEITWILTEDSIGNKYTQTDQFPADKKRIQVGSPSAIDEDTTDDGSQGSRDQTANSTGNSTGSSEAGSDRDSGDRDGDGIPDSEDNCPSRPNADQADLDADGQGNRCDDDQDGDGVENDTDNCPSISNPEQFDSDIDGEEEACDLESRAAPDGNDVRGGNGSGVPLGTPSGQADAPVLSVGALLLTIAGLAFFRRP